MYREFAAYADDMTVVFLDGAVAGGIGFTLTYMRGALMVLILVSGVLLWTSKLDLWWVVRRVTVALVVIALLRAGQYTDYIRTPFWETIPNGIASAFAGGGARTTTAARFDTVSDAAANLVAQADARAGLMNVRAGVAISIAQGAMKAFLFVCFALWLVARVATALLIAAGPFLLIAALFDVSRHIVLSWFGKLVSLAVWTLCSTALTEMVLAGMIRWVQRANALGGAAGLAELVDTLWNVAAWFGVSFVVLLGLPYYAAIGGGAAGGPHVGVGVGMAAARFGAGAFGNAALGAAQLGQAAGRAAARSFNRWRRP